MIEYPEHWDEYDAEARTEIAEKFRWCVYCRADCWDTDGEHAEDCPSKTGVYPVRFENLGPECPHCHERIYGMRCAECEMEFKVGDFYAHQRTEESDVFVTVCLGCQILHPETTLRGGSVSEHRK